MRYLLASGESDRSGRLRTKSDAERAYAIGPRAGCREAILAALVRERARRDPVGAVQQENHGTWDRNTVRALNDQPAHGLRGRDRGNSQKYR
jgi:hypothetical protein